MGVLELEFGDQETANPEIPALEGLHRLPVISRTLSSKAVSLRFTSKAIHLTSSNFSHSLTWGRGVASGGGG